MISSRWTGRTEAIGHSLQEMRSHVRDVAHDEWDWLRSQVSNYFHRGRSRVADLGKVVESEIRTHPVRWLMISAGIGIAMAAVGIAMTRRHR